MDRITANVNIASEVFDGLPLHPVFVYQNNFRKPLRELIASQVDDAVVIGTEEMPHAVNPISVGALGLGDQRSRTIGWSFLKKEISRKQWQRW